VEPFDLVASLKLSDWTRLTAEDLKGNLRGDDLMGSSMH
jgi:hypothetical protein